MIRTVYRTLYLAPAVDLIKLNVKKTYGLSAITSRIKHDFQIKYKGRNLGA